MKKRIKIILILLVLLMIYRRYCVMNVVDEMILSDQSLLFIPYTQAVYDNLDIECKYAGQEDSLWLDDPDLRTIFDYKTQGVRIRSYRYKRSMKIDILLPELGNTQFGVVWKYNVWKKKFSRCLNVYEVEDGYIGFPKKDRETAEELIRDSGMSVEEAYERAEAEMKKFLDEWVQTNEGKSIFSEDHYGWYREGELEYCWENEYAEWF